MLYMYMYTYPLPIHCTEILKISNSGAILEHLFFDVASNIVTLPTFLPGSYMSNIISLIPRLSHRLSYLTFRTIS